MAKEWLLAIAARQVSHRVLAVAMLFAHHADDNGEAQLSRRFVEKSSGAGTVLDGAKGLKVLLNSGWLTVTADADANTRTPRTFRLTTPTEKNLS